METFRRVVLIVMDSVGCGELPDAAEYGDAGADTLGNISRAVGGLNLPNLGRLGLGWTTEIQGVPPRPAAGAYGTMALRSPGKDTMTGHWEMAGIVLRQPLRTYPKGFPPDLVAEYERAIGRRTLGNVVASGTVILEELGAEHLRTGYPIVYTSADSVFQVAAHEAVVPLEELYRYCEIARGMLVGEHLVGRVIARPFVGAPGSFRRTASRRDYALEPPGETLLDRLQRKGVEVTAVGKIHDIYDGRGITRSCHTGGNADGVATVLRLLDEGVPGLIFANLVDFDMLYGHRNDVRGYAAALQDLDGSLPQVFSRLGPGDALVLTADHGCDPTTPETDHTREYVPVMAWGQRIRAGVDVGRRYTLADLGETVAEFFGLETKAPGTSFASQIAGG